MDHSIKYKVRIASHRKTIIAKENDLLADKIQEAGINLSVYCNKKGLCGKCFVEIIKGKLLPLNEREEFFLEKKRPKGNYRLACLSRIHSDLEVRIPEESILQEAVILQTGIRSPILLNPAVKKYYLELQRPEIRLPYSFSELLEKYFKKKKLIIPLPLLKKLPDILERSKFQITATMYNDKEILSVEPKNTTRKNLGIAVDIGTTTVVVELVDLNTGESVDTSTATNSQVKYGSDVVSRISFAFQDSRNLTELKNSILKTLNAMIKNVLDKKSYRSFECL